MNKLAALWKTGLAAFLSVLAQILGVWDNTLTALVILMALDVVTGFIRAFIQQELSSKESGRGIAKKALIFVIVAVAAQADRLLGTDVTRNAVVIWYCASEGLSVLENTVAAGLPVPDLLRDALKQLNERKFPADDV